MIDQSVLQWWEKSSLAHVKRAIEIAANGKHNIMLTGSPASGKTAMFTVLAELEDTRLETDPKRVWMDEIIYINPATVLTRQRALELSFTRMQVAIESHLCPCGYYGDSYHPCTCSVARITAFQRRFHPSLMSAMGLHISMGDTIDKQDRKGETFDVVKSRMITEWVELPMNKEALNFRDIASRKFTYGLSARQLVETMRVANTIALMDGKDKIMVHHIAESLQYIKRVVGS